MELAHAIESVAKACGIPEELVTGAVTGWHNSAPEAYSFPYHFLSFHFWLDDGRYTITCETLDHGASYKTVEAVVDFIKRCGAASDKELEVKF